MGLNLVSCTETEKANKWKKMQGTLCSWQHPSRWMQEMSSCFKENKRSQHSHHQCHVLCHRAASLLGRPMCLNLEGSQALNCLWWIELMICLPPNQILQWCGMKGLYTTSKILNPVQSVNATWNQNWPYLPSIYKLLFLLWVMWVGNQSEPFKQL